MLENDGLNNWSSSMYTGLDELPTLRMNNNAGGL